ncbi:DUF4175 family protein [Roseimaritima ulvae]|uniref:Uncharacterized protein n=1 Tax=Roseimaritima ulvae TaxID=980254 RepID=A0A5B9R8U1_9BACT|nr:DUF4175 family protein [Roseimaritima ulvae]QEG43301.1 hypothetical protein UC8_53480 [Roseimaritima ulvae]
MPSQTPPERSSEVAVAAPPAADTSSADTLPAETAVSTLLGRVERVARRATWWFRLRAMMLLVAVVLLSLGTLVAIDWIWKTPPSAVRYALSILAAVALLAAFWRWARPACSRRAGLLETARRIEYRFPQLSDRLSSLVALAAAGQTPQSVSLVALAADETESQARDLDFSEALDGRRMGWAATALVVVLGLAIGAAYWGPQVVRQGLVRLATPWNASPWPRTDYLALQIEDAVLAGQPVAVVVQNLADPPQPLPRDARVQYRSGSSSPTTVAVDRDSGRATLDLPGSETWFDVRATGGDDDTMRWRRVEIVPPPQLTQAAFLVTPPSASGAEAFTETGRRFAVPQHSRLDFTAHSDRPIQSARLLVASPEQQIPLQVDSPGQGLTGQTITGQWQPETSADSLQVSVAWTDADGLSGVYSRRWQVTLVRDTPPEVRWTMAGEDLRVTRNAVLELSFVARDNYGLVASGLQWTSALAEPPIDAEEAAEWPYYQAEASPQQTRNVTLSVAELAGSDSSSGAAWRLQAVAEDTAGQVGHSLPLRVYLLSEQDLLTELTKDSQQVLEQVRAAVRSQQIAAERTREAALQSDPGRRQDSLNIAQAAQQQALQQVEGPAAALPVAEQIAGRAATNQLQSTFLENVQQAAEQLAQLRERNLQPSAQTLEAAVNQDAGSPSPAVLADLADRQAAAAEQLQRIGEQLAAGLESQLVAESIRDAAAAQQRLAAASRRVGGEDAEGGQQQDLADALADQQRDVARQTERLQDRLQDMAAAARQNGQTGQRLNDAAEQLSGQQIADRMRDAADDLQQQQSDAAADAQQAIARDMRRIASEFADSQDASGSRDAGRLAEQAARLAQRQREVSQQIAETLRREGVDSETAIAQQSDTLEAVERLRPDLESMPLFPAALDQAEQRMESALARMQRSPTDSQAYEDARDAGQRLDEIASAIEQSARTESSSEQANADADPPPSEEAADGAEDNPQSLPIASLFLVRSMQTRLRNETAELNEQAVEPESDEAMTRIRQQRQQLSQQQAQLAQRLQALLNDFPSAAAASPQEEVDNE